MKPAVSLAWGNTQSTFDLAFRATGSHLPKRSISIAITTFLCSPCISIRLYNIYFHYCLNKLLKKLESPSTDKKELIHSLLDEQLSMLIKIFHREKNFKKEIVDLFSIRRLSILIELGLFNENEICDIIDCYPDEQIQSIFQNHNDMSLSQMLKSPSQIFRKKLINLFPNWHLLRLIHLGYFKKDKLINVIDCCPDELVARFICCLSNRNLLKLLQSSDQAFRGRIAHLCSDCRFVNLMNFTFPNENALIKIFEGCSQEKTQSILCSCSDAQLLQLLKFAEQAFARKIAHLPDWRLSKLIVEILPNENALIKIFEGCSQEKIQSILCNCSDEHSLQLLQLSTQDLKIKIINSLPAWRLLKLTQPNCSSASELIKIFECCSDEQAQELIQCCSDKRLAQLLKLPDQAFREKIANLCPVRRLLCLTTLHFFNENELIQVIDCCSDEQAQELIQYFSDERLAQLLKSPDRAFIGKAINLCPAWRLFTLISQNHFTDHDVQCIINLCSKEKLSELIQFPHWRFSTLVKQVFFKRQRILSALLNTFQEYYKSQNLSFQQTLLFLKSSHFTQDTFNALFFVKMDYIEKIHQKISQRELEDFLQQHATTPLDLNSLFIEQLDWTLPGHPHRVALSDMIRAIQERTPILGAPPLDNTEKFQTFYQNMENGLRFITHRLIDTHMPLTQDQKEILFHTLTHAARHCATSWADAINKAVNGICGGSMEIAVTLEEQTMQSVHKLLRNTDNKLLQYYKALYSYYNAPNMEIHVQQAMQMTLYNFFSQEGYPSDFVVESETLIPPRSLQELREDERACSIRDRFKELYSPHAILQVVLERIRQDQFYASSIYAQAVELAKRYREEASGNAEPLSSATFMDITCPESAHYSPNPVLIIKLLIDMGILEAYSPAFNGSFGNPESAPAE